MNDLEPFYDGRHSMANGDQNLTYAYFKNQGTYVTGHFVIRQRLPKNPSGEGPKIVYSANYPTTSILSSDRRSKYLRGELVLQKKDCIYKAAIDYGPVYGLELKKNIIPVRKNFKPVSKSRHKTAFYKVSYRFQNPTPTTKAADFQLRLDPELGQNDGPAMEAFKFRKGLGKIVNIFERHQDTILKKNQRISTPQKWRKRKNAILYHPEVVRNRPEKIAMIYTGRRKKDIQPQKIYLGSWREQSNELWKVPSKKGQYGDAGLVMEYGLKVPPGDSLEISYYQGLYQPGMGRRIFSPYQKPEVDLKLAFQKPVDYLNGTFLAVEEDEATIGDTAHVVWNIFHREECADKLDQLDGNVPGLKYYNGSDKVLVNCTDSIYYMVLRLEKSKVNAMWSDTLTPRLPYEGDTANNSINSGLFTLGAENTPLLFGYPYPSTTSHFVLRSRNVRYRNMRGEREEIQAQDRDYFYASNEKEIIKGIPLGANFKLKPQFPARQLEYVLGRQSNRTYSNGKFYQHLYALKNGVDSVYLSQKITPCDYAFRESKKGDRIFYYKVEFEIRNATCNQEKEREFKLSYMLDPRLGTDEMGYIQVKDSIYPGEKSFTIEKPSMLTILPQKADTAVMGLNLRFGTDGSPQPEVIYNTLWQSQRKNLTGVASDLKIRNDRALFIEWPALRIYPGGTKKISFLIGNDSSSNTEIIFAKPIKKEEVVWFDYDRDTLIRGEQLILEKLLANHLWPKKDQKGKLYRPFSHLVLEGFTGSVGSEVYNQALAGRRLEYVKKWLVAKGIPSKKILTKINGEYYADEDPIRQRVRNSERVVRIKIYP
ncbi:MAG: OmpA family protein [Bacteroidia bacterium]|nr:OmpA family protein [Bacteroidia bacterium]